MENLFYFIVEAGKVWGAKAAYQKSSFDAGYAYDKADYKEFLNVMRAPTIMRNEVEMQNVMLQNYKTLPWKKTFTPAELIAALGYVDPELLLDHFSPEEIQKPASINAADPRFEAAASKMEIRLS